MPKEYDSWPDAEERQWKRLLSHLESHNCLIELCQSGYKLFKQWRHGVD